MSNLSTGITLGIAGTIAAAKLATTIHTIRVTAETTERYSKAALVLIMAQTGITEITINGETITAEDADQITEDEIREFRDHIGLDDEEDE